MSEEEILEELEKLLVGMDLEVRYEKGEFFGGIYRYKEKKQLLVNKKLDTEQRIKVIASELSDKIDLDNTFMVPALREVIENASRVE